MPILIVINGGRATVPFYFASQDGVQFAEAEPKNSIYAWYFTKVSVCKEEHWIIQFRQWTKHADELLVCGRINRW